MKKQPFFSIITCAKNSEKYLKECLDSVAKQTWRDFEHIFIDGYSIDKTLEIVSQYQKENPDIAIKLIQAKPRGIANAMNLGVKNSRGKIIHVLHSDDYYYSEKSLQIAAYYFQKNSQTNWLVGNNIVRIKNKEFVWGWSEILQKLYTLSSIFYHPNIFMKKQIFDNCGFFNETYKICMDYEHCLRVLKLEKPRFVRENLAVFRIHKHSASSGTNPKNKLIIIKERFRAEAENSDTIKKPLMFLKKELANFKK
ncbi:MAG: glycosyltransferase [Patescibacteria group bacterium]